MAGKPRPADADVSLFQHVLLPELQRVNTQLVSDDVHVRLDGEGHIGHTGGTVRADVDLVGVHAIRAQPEVGYVVCPQPMADAGVGAGAQVRAHVKDAAGLAGGDFPVAGDGGLEVDVGFQPRAVEGEGLLASVDQLDRAMRLHG